MNSLQMDLIIFSMGYVIAFIVYLIDRNLGLKIKGTMDLICISFIMYLIICSIH